MNTDVLSSATPLATVEWSEDPKVDAAALVGACRDIVGAASHRPPGAVPTRQLLAKLRAALTQLDLNENVR